VTAACSGSDSSSTRGSTTAPRTESTTESTAASTIGPTSGSAVPAPLDFAAPAVGGGSIDMRSFAGTTVALWFWAPY
jgi:hypothetical protein